MSDVPPHVRELLEAHDWEDTVPRLVKYARGEMGRRVWQGVFGGTAPGGKQAYDLVTTAVEKLFDGRRAWDPETQPDLFVHLQGIVDSDMGHLARSLGNKLTLRAMGRPVGSEDAVEDFPDPMDEFASSTPSPEAVTLLREQEQLSEDFLLELDGSLQGEPELQRIVEAIVDGAEKSAEIAEEAGITPKAVYNARKRLQRKLDEFRKQRETTRKAS